RDNGSTVTPGPTADSVCTTGPTECSRIDPDGAGSAPAFALYNPDFRTRSLSVKAVWRWEYRPGSTIFFAWTHSRSGYFPYDASFDVGRDVGRDDQKEARVGTTLMQLSRGMQVPRAEPERGRAAPKGAGPGRAHRLHPGRDVGVGRQVGEDGKIVSRSERAA